LIAASARSRAPPPSAFRFRGHFGSEQSAVLGFERIPHDLSTEGLEDAGASGLAVLFAQLGLVQVARQRGGEGSLIFEGY
jgi:hypothetical protein